MGRLKALVPITISLLIAIAGSYFLYQWVDKQRAPAEVITFQETSAVPVTVAAMDLTLGTKITSDMIKRAPYLKESLPTGHFINLEDIKGRVLITSLKINDPITESKLAPESVKIGGVSAIISPGMRAIAVKGDKVMGISGFINPGNYVDVIVTVEDPDSKKVKSKIVLENLPVLATGTQVQTNEKGEPMPVDVYTMEVTPQQAEKLALAGAEGRLNFALRGATDYDEVYTKGATVPQILAYPDYSGRPMVASLNKQNLEKMEKNPVTKIYRKQKKWAPRKSMTVEIIKGITLTKKNFTP